MIGCAISWFHKNSMGEGFFRMHIHIAQPNTSWCFRIIRLRANKRRTWYVRFTRNEDILPWTNRIHWKPWLIPWWENMLYYSALTEIMMLLRIVLFVFLTRWWRSPPEMSEISYSFLTQSNLLIQILAKPELFHQNAMEISKLNWWLWQNVKWDDLLSNCTANYWAPTIIDWTRRRPFQITHRNPFYVQLPRIQPIYGGSNSHIQTDIVMNVLFRFYLVLKQRKPFTIACESCNFDIWLS